MAQDPDPERDAPDSNGQVPPNLTKFRHMTARNLGIYRRIISEERKATAQYYTMSLIINASFLGQIIVAASLTALGASDGSHTLITILGSVNTVIAGIQTYLKGQGLPNRIKQYQFGLRKLREYIEDRERDFSHPACKLDVDLVIKDVAAMYQAVRQTAEDNTPDTYLPMEGAGKKLLGHKDDRVTPVDQIGAGIAPPGTGINDLRAAEEAEAEAHAEGSGAGHSGGSGGGQNKAEEVEDDESTPLLKQTNS